MRTINVVVLPQGKKLSILEKDNLLTCLRHWGADMESPCGGKGTCGKCKIQIVDGLVSQPTEEEVKHLSLEELNNDIRLACLTRPLSDVVIRLFKEEKVDNILSEGFRPEITTNPLINKKVINFNKPNSNANLSYSDIIQKASGITEEVLFDLNKLRSLPDIFQGNIVTAVFSGNRLLGFEAGDTSGYIYGIAVDIGTTTVVVSLINLLTGKELDHETSINPQKSYGLDVLSRIDFVMKEKNGLVQLQKTMIRCLNDLIEKLCRRSLVLPDSIYEVAVAANATMMHLFLGVSPVSIGISPYSPIFSQALYIKAQELGIKVSTLAQVYCLPGVSGYIGADIVAGAVVANLAKEKRNLLFIDIGTNGEIILSKSGEMWSCSCAAGPALEGMNISSGMRAAKEAVESVRINNDIIELKVIGEVTPTGICGSGIIDAVSEFLRVGLIEKSGRLKKKSDFKINEQQTGLDRYICEADGKKQVLLKLGPDAFGLTQADIRQVQLAKGAILSGFLALLELTGLDMEQLDEVIIAGQFGAHLSTESLVGIGLVPEKLKDKVRYVGNSAITGALMCLLSMDIRDELKDVAGQINYFELSTMDGYESLFTKCLSF